MRGKKMTKTDSVKKAATKPAATAKAPAAPAVPAKPAVKKAPAAKPGAAAAKKPAASAKTKSAKPAKAVKAALKSAKSGAKPRVTTVEKDKVKKPKLVRDSFTMPEAEYQVLGDVKKACLKAGIAVKKSELLRVGVALLKGLDSARLKDLIAALPPLKAGRPKQEK
jgi:hypothetical protein